MPVAVEFIPRSKSKMLGSRSDGTSLYCRAAAQLFAPQGAKLGSRNHWSKRGAALYDPVCSAVDMWICPYCRQQVPLTWRRYFTEPGRKRRCDHCGRISRLNGTLSPRIWTLRILGILAGGIPVCILGCRIGFLAGPAGFVLAGQVGFVLGALATGLPFDKYLDERYRQLTEIREEMAGLDNATCAQCGGFFRIEEMIAFDKYHVCARCKPVFLQKLAEGTRIEPPPSEPKL